MEDISETSIVTCFLEEQATFSLLPMNSAETDGYSFGLPNKQLTVFVT